MLQLGVTANNPEEQAERHQCMQAAGDKYRGLFQYSQQLVEQLQQRSKQRSGG